MKRKINIRRVGMLVFIVISLAISFIGATHGNEEQKEIKAISSNNSNMTSAKTMQSKKIVIDAGHGGDESPGCVVNNVMEKHICLKIANKVKNKLEQKGYTVIMTRDTDTYIPLNERCEIANRNLADAFISIHLNSLENDKTTNGIETWFNPEKDKCSKKLAQNIQEEIIKTTEADDKGIKESTELVVIRNTSMASCLVETGFLTSNVEHKKLQNEEYQEKIAEGIVNGIVKYIDF